jgi:hypothetical protein
MGNICFFGEPLNLLTWIEMIKSNGIENLFTTFWGIFYSNLAKGSALGQTSSPGDVLGKIC